MTNTQRAEMCRQIEDHGRQLLAIFPQAKEQDPIKLCKALRRWERKAEAVEIDYCNGVISDEEEGEKAAHILKAVKIILGPSPLLDEVFINRDPRGYALKLKSEAAKDLNISRDWGGYGILAPDFTPNN